MGHRDIGHIVVAFLFDQCCGAAAISGSRLSRPGVRFVMLRSL